MTTAATAPLEAATLPGTPGRTRILYVTNGFPWPLTSGYLRHYHLIRELARRHEIVLCSLVGADHRASDEDALTPFATEIHTVLAARGSGSLRRKVGGRLRALAGRGDASAIRLGAAAAAAAEAHRPDVVIFSGKRTYPVLEALAAVEAFPVIADLCDATSLRVRGALRYARLRRRPLLWLDLAEVRRVEGRLLRDADALVFASARDRDALVRDAGARSRSAIIANGVDLGHWTRANRALGDEIVFTGAMDYPPNADAARFLVDEILPQVRAQRPGARLTIVGRDPGPAVLQLGDRPGITVTGFVDDVRPYLERAAVFAAPLRFGAGIQNKVLEALAMEVPVVASTLAAAGLHLDGEPAPPVAVADDPGAFAARIVERLDRAAVDPVPDAAGRGFVGTHFGWSAAGGRLARIVAEVVAARRGAATGTDGVGPW